MFLIQAANIKLYSHNLYIANPSHEYREPTPHVVQPPRKPSRRRDTRKLTEAPERFTPTALKTRDGRIIELKH